MSNQKESIKVWSAIRSKQRINGDSDLRLANQLLVKPRTLRQYDKENGEHIQLEQLNHYCKVNKTSLLNLLLSVEKLLEETA